MRIMRLGTTVLLSLIFANAVWPQGVITTIAGTDFVFTGDGKPALQAQLGQVYSLAVDASGNVYTGDAQNHMAYRIGADGTLTVVAGNGIEAETGDGGPARQASIAGPANLALGPQGDLFINDAVGAVIRKVDRNGMISAVASFGGTNSGPFAVGPDG